MTKEEIIASVKECAARLGHPPTRAEFYEMTKVPRRQMVKHFGTHKAMLAESGIEGEGPGYPIPMRSLFLEWAGITRALGKVPTVVEYKLHGKHSVGPLVARFGSWLDVPAAMMRWAREQAQEGEWNDVMEIVVLHQQSEAGSLRKSKRSSNNSNSKLRLRRGEPTYGRPLPHAPLSYAPTNEAGVVLLFGGLARAMGFVILRAQAEFPDCEAMREIGPNRWQRVRIEFEYESRNFSEHMHPVKECDLIVCWNNNWPECPLEVLELQSVSGAAEVQEGELKIEGTV